VRAAAPAVTNYAARCMDGGLELARTCESAGHGLPG
jgi:hypothetical protein